MRTRLKYTKVPRTILWLVEGGSMTQEREGGETVETEIDSFYLSKFPVTNEQFEAFDPQFERQIYSLGDRDPALGISWQRAHDYCCWYAEVARKPMRLPTELEWEWACRADPESGTYFDQDEMLDYVWFRENAPESAIPRFDKKRSNPAGLWAMLGGVWEWMSEPPEAHSGQAAERVLRGGSYRSFREELKVDLRRIENLDVVIEDAGLRVAKSLRGS